jgi:hypothetical protein
MWSPPHSTFSRSNSNPGKETLTTHDIDTTPSAALRRHRAVCACPDGQVCALCVGLSDPEVIAAADDCLRELGLARLIPKSKGG